MVELLVVVGVIGVLMVLSLPMFLSYWQSSTLKSGAQEMVVLLNTARQLAIKENTNACVTGDGSGTTYGPKVKYALNTTTCSSSTPSTTCTSSSTAACVWIGPGTGTDGYMTVSNSLEALPPANGISFTYLGASTGGDFRVKNPVNNATATVTVAVSGRTRISYP